MVLILTWAKGQFSLIGRTLRPLSAHSAAEEMSVADRVCVALLADRPAGTKYRFDAQKREQKQEQEQE